MPGGVRARRGAEALLVPGTELVRRSAREAGPQEENGVRSKGHAAVRRWLQGSESDFVKVVGGSVRILDKWRISPSHASPFLRAKE